jgi:hypothetical protein
MRSAPSMPVGSYTAQLAVGAGITDSAVAAPQLDRGGMLRRAAHLDRFDALFPQSSSVKLCDNRRRSGAVQNAHASGWGEPPRRVNLDDVRADASEHCRAKQINLTPLGSHVGQVVEFVTCTTLLFETE